MFPDRKNLVRHFPRVSYDCDSFEWLANLALDNWVARITSTRFAYSHFTKYKIRPNTLSYLLQLVKQSLTHFKLIIQVPAVH